MRQVFIRIRTELHHPKTAAFVGKPFRIAGTSGEFVFGRIPGEMSVVVTL